MTDSKESVRQLITDFARDNANIASLKFIRDDPHGVAIEAKTSFVNFVYKVTSKDGQHSVIIKHGKTCFKRISTDHITLERQVLEYNCLNLMESITPGSAPKPYCLDRTYNIIAMEDLSDWDEFKDSHEVGKVDLDVAASLGHLLAKVHQLTSKSEVSPERWIELQMFRQDELKSCLGKYLFEVPYDTENKINKPPAGTTDTYRQYVKEMKDLGYNSKMVDLYWEEKCFIHADCHWMAIFMKNGKAKLFDFEFGFLSHPAQNFGFLVMSYYFCYVFAKNKSGKDSPKTDLATKFRQAVKIFLDAYLKDITYMSDGETKEFLTHTALFAGGIMFGKSMFSPREGLSYWSEPANLKQFYTGFRLMRDHEHLQSVEALVSTLFDDQ